MQWRNVIAEPMEHVSNWRKMTMGTWRAPSEGHVYGILPQDCSKLLPYLEQVNARAGDVKVTINHLVGKTVSIVLHEYPQLNGIILRGRLYRRRTVDIFFQVDLSGTEAELSGIVIRECENKTLLDIAREVRDKALEIRENKKSPARKALNLFKLVPWNAVPLMVRAVGFLQYTLNLNLEPLGVPRDAFGGVMINSIGSLGQEMAFAPLVPPSRVPCLVGPGKIVEKPVVVDGKVEIRPMMNVCTTFDHRFMDGVMGAKMGRRMSQILDDPMASDQLLGGGLS
jgi:pyruvate/2-oxoglutarate dehydrogenase complex dihydrolipoamide acyltransferase (E2) component